MIEKIAKATSDWNQQIMVSMTFSLIFCYAGHEILNLSDIRQHP